MHHGHPGLRASLIAPLLALQATAQQTGSLSERAPEFALSSSTNATFWIAKEEAKLIAGDAAPFDGFGCCLAISGDTAAVGSPGDGHLGGLGVGHVYVFGRSGTSWTEEQKLTGSDTTASDVFGSSVAIEGDRIVVGASQHDPGGLVNAGAVYVFVHGGGAWSQEAKLTASDATQDSVFGQSVALSGDNLLVGAGGGSTGSAYVFVRTGSSWVEQQKLTASDPSNNMGFGYPVALADDTAVIGAVGNVGGVPQSGSAYVFVRTGTIWSEQQKLTPSDPASLSFFGGSLALSGDTVLIGASNHPWIIGSAYVFVRSGSSWSEQQRLMASDGQAFDNFGRSVALVGDTALIGALSTEGSVMWPSGLAWDPGAGQLYASGKTLLARVDLSTGYATIVGEIGFDEVNALEFEPITGTLYGADNATDQLIRIDPSTGAGTAVGKLGFKRVRGLALDPSTGTLYGVDDFAGVLLTIDPSTGAGTTVGPHGSGKIAGLAFDPMAGVLYGSDVASDQLLRIDPTTGSAAIIGSLGFDEVKGLAFDPLTGTLYGSDPTVDPSYSGGRLLTIDTATGAATVHGFFEGRGAGSAYVFARSGTSWTEQQKLIASDSMANDWFGAYVALSGDTALIGAEMDDHALKVAGSVAGQGSAYVFRLSPESPAIYCTAGTSASGCRALLSASGVASSSAASGFVLTAVDVEGTRNGLFTLGTNGRQANPWGNGTSFQCIAPPVANAEILLGTGTLGLCDGGFTQDLNGLWCPTCPKPTKNPGTGAIVQAQLWYRDPLSTSSQTTSLSDAIEFGVAP